MTISPEELTGIVVTPEDFEEAWCEPDSLTTDTAAMLAGVVFSKVTGLKIENQSGTEEDEDEEEWHGFVNEYKFTLSKDGDDFILDFEEV